MINPLTNTQILDKDDARKAINDLIAKADALVHSEATAIADEYGVEFSFGEYGSGATYHPTGTDKDDLRWSNYYGGYDENEKSTEGYWMSSSETC